MKTLFQILVAIHCIIAVYNIVHVFDEQLPKTDKFVRTALGMVFLAIAVLLVIAGKQV